MTPPTADLPNTGDVIEFTDVPVGSLLVKGARYRVEHKSGSDEYLLIDTLSGHAGRVSAHELKSAAWRAAAAKAEAASSSDAKPLSSEGSEGILDLKPLPAAQ